MFIYSVIAFAISLAVTFAFQPKNQDIKPSGINDFNVPTAEEGREIPVLFGTREIAGSNVIWYGDLRTSPIKK